MISYDKLLFEDYVLNFVDIKYRIDLRYMKYLYIFLMFYKEIYLCYEVIK